MNDLSPTTKALLRAAREDAPSAGARARIWNGVALGAVGGAAVGSAAGGKALAGAGTAKALFVTGALLGSAITVGVAAMVLHVGAPKLHPEPAVVVRADDQAAVVAPAAHPAEPAAAVDEDAPTTPSSAKHAARAKTVEDTLAREAELVAEARGAIVRGQPRAALGALRAAQALPGHTLEPEELSLEVRALRAVGDLDGANAVDAKLRAKYPDHALAR